MIYSSQEELWHCYLYCVGRQSACSALSRSPFLTLSKITGDCHYNEHSPSCCIWHRCPAQNYKLWKLWQVQLTNIFRRHWLGTALLLFILIGLRWILWVQPWNLSAYSQSICTLHTCKYWYRQLRPLLLCASIFLIRFTTPLSCTACHCWGWKNELARTELIRVYLQILLTVSPPS